MSVSIKSHVFDKLRALEIIDIEDSHGRQHQIQAPILGEIEPDAFIQKEIAEFEAAETKITEHIENRFHPETLERLETSVEEK